MEKLYSSLREELKIFEDQVQKCRVNFDLQTLQRALALLSEDHKEDLESWEKINQYVQSTSTSGEQGLQLRRYFTWLLSYVGYLRTMKDAFDDHVFFRLCDNLYRNDEAETPSVPSSIPLSPGNIMSTARQLFHHRRSWALLLSSESRNTHGPSRPMGLLHCIPDIFEESLVTANLARNWILLHEARNKNPSNVTPQQSQLDHEFRVEKPRELFGSTESAANEETQTQLKEVREHMMFLLWRAGRAGALEQQVKDTKQKIRSLQQDINELQQLMQRDGQEPSDNLENQRRLKKLQRQLELETYQQRIVICDWQLELEVRPSFIRQMDMKKILKTKYVKISTFYNMPPEAWTLHSSLRKLIATNQVQERCTQLEASLNPQKEPRQASALESVGVFSDGEWENSSIFSHGSDCSSDIFSPH